MRGSATPSSRRCSTSSRIGAGGGPTISAAPSTCSPPIASRRPSALVHEGHTVTMSLPLNTRPQANPVPADHRMTLLGDAAPGAAPLQFLKDYVGADYHNDGHSHIDALSHVAYRGALYNDRPEDSVTAGGAAWCDRGAARRAGRSRRPARHPSCARRGVARAGRTRLRQRSRSGGARAGGDGSRGRHPADTDRSRAPARRARAVEHPGGEGRPAPDLDAVRSRPRRRRPRIRRKQ